MGEGRVRSIIQTNYRRFRNASILIIILCATTFVLLPWYRSSGVPWWKFRYFASDKQEKPSLQQELTKRNIKKIVEEFWNYLKTELTNLSRNMNIKNTTSETQLIKLINYIDAISYKRWMQVKDLKFTCLKAISAWRSIRKNLLNIEKKTGLSYIGLLVRNSGDFPRLVGNQLDKMTDAVESPSGWKKEESLKLGEMIKRNMFALQNPSNCSNIKKLICEVGRGCGSGFGCQVHHISSCLLMAYATNRTLIFNFRYWAYTKPWESIFLPFTSTCTIAKTTQPTAQLGDVGWQKEQIVGMPHLHQKENLTDLLPPSLPEHLTDKMLHFHGFPHAWWVGQFIRYAMRGQPTFDKLLSDTLHDLNFTHPIVGVHIRRTDKLRSEAKLYPVEDYMIHVSSWYDHYQRWRPHTRIERKVFVATDEPDLLDSLEEKYPDYVFVFDRSRSNAADVTNRRSESGFTGITLDTSLLSLTDFLVCTFSSNVGRAAYALMQTRNGDASQWAVSLDKAFFYMGQNPYTVKAIANHDSQRPRNKLSTKDTISYIQTPQNGFLTGRKSSSGEKGTFPTFKTADVIKRVSMPHY